MRSLYPHDNVKIKNKNNPSYRVLSYSDPKISSESHLRLQLRGLAVAYTFPKAKVWSKTYTILHHAQHPRDFEMLEPCSAF